jgi:hypothetical protein
MFPHTNWPYSACEIVIALSFGGRASTAPFVCYKTLDAKKLLRSFFDSYKLSSAKNLASWITKIYSLTDAREGWSHGWQDVWKNTTHRLNSASK